MDQHAPAAGADGAGVDAGAAGRAIAAWFAGAARALPWRVPGRGEAAGLPRDPYHALVAEAMLQQTQVSRVIEKYAAFIAAFPTVRDLARADEHRVLEMWAGLGYYRRARHLHAAAKAIVEQFGGRVPREVDALRSLPGVGRYTAGAIASIAFNQPAAIVDGNVARVLLRLHGRDAASDDKAVQAWLWEAAGELAATGPAKDAPSPGAVNEGLMELGATVCVPPPAEPKCDACPLRAMCAARRDGRQLEIPRAKTRAERTDVYCLAARVVRDDGAVLLEQRPQEAMWGGMWQAPTLERTDRFPTRAELAAALGVPAKAMAGGGSLEFLATHRRLRFRVVRVTIADGVELKRGVFVPAKRAAGMAMGSPQRRVINERLR